MSIVFILPAVCERHKIVLIGADGQGMTVRQDNFIKLPMLWISTWKMEGAMVSQDIAVL